jgi:hypothetical protein
MTEIKLNRKMRDLVVDRVMTICAKDRTPPSRDLVDDVVTAQRLAGGHGVNRDKIGAAHGVGPHKIQLLSNRVNAVLAGLSDLDHAPIRSKSWNGKSGDKRLRELRAQGDDDYAALLDVQLRIARAVAVLEDIRVQDYGLDEVSLWKISDLHDDLISLGEWQNRAISAVQAHLGDASVAAKIAKLREHSGRTPAERETAELLAARLEKKLTTPRLHGA